MRSALLLAALVACAPKVSTLPPSFDEDLGDQAPVPTDSEPLTDEQRPVATPGKVLRAGTIARDRLVAVLDAGPAQFLRQLEVTPRLNGERFVGWQLVQLLDHTGPLHDVDVVPGDVLLAINGKPLSRPDQLQTMWESLRTANVVQAQLWRGDAKFTLDFAIEPAVTEMTPAPAPPMPPKKK
ncbi:MAG: hypothetical protein H0T42_09890 [Deltaproteobacteria bacterium]|nr:hypothetical protein [Deltaproteobacteria bacterium]